MALVSTADIVFGSGPVLTQYGARLAESMNATPLIPEYTPGVDFQELVQPPAPDGPYNILVFGRLDDDRKCVGDAADMVRELTNRGFDVTLTAVGARPETVSRAQQLLSQRAGRSVTVLAHTPDPADIRREMSRAHLVLMPSRAESFGLVVTEALGAGVPVLFPDTSGAGRFFADPERFPPELTSGFLVPQDYIGPPSIPLWADWIERQLLDQQAAWARARRIRQLLLDNKVTWQSAIEVLLQAAAYRRSMFHDSGSQRAP